MFEWLHALRREDPLLEMVEEFRTMMDNNAWMYEQAVGLLTREIAYDAIADDLYARDKKVNKSQRRIRKRIVRHLAAQPESDMPACLVLMSIVKDAERLGDYAKNLFEVGYYYTGTLEEDDIGPALRRRLLDVRKMFDLSCRAYAECDESLAHEVVSFKHEVSKECDELLERLFESDLPTNRAVAFTLLTRYTKRITNHLYNIASGVIEPVHKVDYADE
jgi:phosphate uptake regulator